jgi:hypothetical protein
MARERYVTVRGGVVAVRRRLPGRKRHPSTLFGMTPSRAEGRVGPSPQHTRT